MKRVSYFGPEHTNTHLAAQNLFGSSAQYFPELTKTAVFSAVEEGRADVGVLPIENSTEGIVRETLDGLIHKQPVIAREHEMNIRHCLMARHDSSTHPSRIVSHPQPLAQCRRFLSNHFPTVVQETAVSTAQAAQMAAASPGTFAIATQLAAEAYGLRILFEQIADRPHNATRFICIAMNDAPPSGHDKTSLVFTARHEKGGLLRVLSIFDGAGVNLTRIESRPLSDRKWEYDFVVELEGHRLRPPVSVAVAELEKSGSLRKILGSYRAFDAASTPTPTQPKASSLDDLS